MGYCTRFRLETDQDDIGNKHIINVIDNETLGFTCDWSSSDIIEALNGGTDRLKWYDYKEDMMVLSTRFPDVLFTLHGEGEEAEDLWRLYAKGGKIQLAEAEITYPPCKL